MSRKPAPISMSLSKRPSPKQIVPPALPTPMEREDEGADDVAERLIALEALGGRITRLEKAKPAAAPEIAVSFPPRARITQVSIHYDQFGMPSKLVPSYTE